MTPYGSKPASSTPGQRRDQRVSDLLLTIGPYKSTNLQQRHFSFVFCTLDRCFLPNVRYLPSPVMPRKEDKRAQRKRVALFLGDRLPVQEVASEDSQMSPTLLHMLSIAPSCMPIPWAYRGEIWEINVRRCGLGRRSRGSRSSDTVYSRTPQGTFPLAQFVRTFLSPSRPSMLPCIPSSNSPIVIILSHHTMSLRRFKKPISTTSCP